MSESVKTNARPLSLVLLGFGKMGKTIAHLAPQRGFKVRQTFDIDVNTGGAAITRENFQDIDVCIEFTTPDAAFENIRGIAAIGVNLVVGTTGWYGRLEEVRSIIQDAGVGMVYAPNFSIGVNLFYRAAREAAKIFSGFTMYDPYLTEAHHKFKKDAPSGTALELKRQVQPFYKDHDVPVASVRAGYIPGIHELGFDSEADTIVLRHTARGRQGFAEGALYAARWVVGRKGLFSFAEVLEEETRDSKNENRR